MADEFDIELFIGEVRKQPAIWDVAAEDYHNRNKKRSAWIHVCRVFADGFHNKDDRERNEICNKLIKKWRNVKDNFIKSLKKKTRSGQAAFSGRRYIYAPQLSFLQQTGATTDSPSSSGFDDEQDDPGQSESNTPTPEAESEYTRPPRHDNHPRKRRRDLESSLIDFMNAPLPPSRATAVPEPNSDRLFFESILPSLSGFTEDKKLEFRCEVLNVIKRMRMSQQNASSHVDVPPQQGCAGCPPNRTPLNVPSFETPRCPSYLPQTSCHLSSSRLTEMGIRSHSDPLPQAHSSGMNLSSVSPHM